MTRLKRKIAMIMCGLFMLMFWNPITVRKFHLGYWSLKTAQSYNFISATTPSFHRTEFQSVTSAPLTMKHLTRGNNVLSSLVVNQETNCTRKKNIVFVKTHKTASTAIQNVLLRYGLHHQLNFAFPENTLNFNYPAWFNRASVAKFGSHSYNIICHHMRLKYEEVRAVMPKDSLFVTIVREPGQLFESMFDFMWPIVPAFQQVPHHSNTSIEDWLDDAEKHFRMFGRSTYGHLAKNPTFFDLGYDHTNQNSDYVKKAISDISERFNLILVSDYMDESMVLLADLLCWQLDDVACLNLNARSSQHDVQAENRHNRIRKKARRWNLADAALFDHFNTTLWHKIEEYGYERMKIATAKLQNIKKNLTEMCIEGGKAVDSSKIVDKTFKESIFKPEGVSVLSYNLKPNAENIQTCRELVASENPFSKKLFEAQKNRLMSKEIQP